MENKSIFDLDKTLISINSFPFWIVFVLLNLLLNFKFNKFREAVKALWKRKIRKKISHIEFKNKMVLITSEEKFHIKFSFFLAGFMRKKVCKKLVGLHSEGHRIAITSAAPEIYLKPFVEKAFPGISGDIFTTGSKPNEDEIWEENFGEAKLQYLVKSGFLAPDENFHAFFTDSWDDIALAKKANTVFLVNPGIEDKKKYLETPGLRDKIQLL